MRKFTPILLALTMTACGFPGVYKINVQQGNIVEQKMLDQLKVGQTRDQVHYVMGTPVIEFGLQRKIERYVYTYQKGDQELEQQLVTIYYQDEVVTEIDSSGLLAEVPAY